jgi:hypothetical protein
MTVKALVHMSCAVSVCFLWFLALLFKKQGAIVAEEVAGKKSLLISIQSEHGC